MWLNEIVSVRVGMPRPAKRHAAAGAAAGTKGPGSVRACAEQGRLHVYPFVCVNGAHTRGEP